MPPVKEPKTRRSAIDVWQGLSREVCTANWVLDCNEVGRPRLAGRGWLCSAASSEKRRQQMKPGTKDQIQGNVHELKGKVKETAGQVTNNPNLAAEGQNEKLAGTIQKKVGQVEKVFEK
jgi:uncharacterized protein YjbJ (UPF0337 family)